MFNDLFTIFHLLGAICFSLITFKYIQYRLFEMGIYSSVPLEVKNYTSHVTSEKDQKIKELELMIADLNFMKDCTIDYLKSAKEANDTLIQNMNNLAEQNVALRQELSKSYKDREDIIVSILKTK